jgi:galactitol-specific phosphotransferase system IIB component
MENLQKCILAACGLGIVSSVPKWKIKSWFVEKSVLVATECAVFTVPVYRKGQSTLLCNSKGTPQRTLLGNFYIK